MGGGPDSEDTLSDFLSGWPAGGAPTVHFLSGCEYVGAGGPNDGRGPLFLCAPVGDAMGRWRELYRRFWIVRLLTAVGFLLLGAGGTALWRWWHG